MKNILPQSYHHYVGETDFFSAIYKPGIFSGTIIWNHVPELFN